ncbi:MAG: methyltransferase domain-containing protein [Nanoarchaeota archaeon]
MVTQEEIWDIEYKNDDNKWKKESTYLPEMLRDRNVLELGVGNGKTLLSILKQKPKSVTAIDFSQEAINICKSNIKNKEVLLIKSDVNCLPFRRETFDVIICYYILNNLKEKERLEAIKEIFRVLRNKGVVVFEDFMVGDFRQKVGKIIEFNTIEKKSGLIQHFFTKLELTTLFNRFSSFQFKEKSFLPFKNKKDIQRKIICGIIRK